MRAAEKASLLMLVASSSDRHNHLPAPLTPSCARPYAKALAIALSTGQLRDGRHTEALEQVLGAFFGAHAVAVGSGMDALELLLETHGARGRRVLVPAHCFPAIPAVAAHLGGTPVPTAVDPATLAPPADIEADDGALLIWIHHAGIVAEYAASTIQRLRASGMTVIEDCAYVLPDNPDGPGQWGDAAVFSFAPTKPISGSGGAAIVTKDRRVAGIVRGRRTHSGVEDRWAAGDQLLRWRGISEPEALLAWWRWRQRAAIAAQLARVRARYRTSLLGRRASLLPAGRTPSATWGRYTLDFGDLDARQVKAALAEHGIHSSLMTPTPWFDYPALSAYAPREEQPDLRRLLDRTLAVPYHPRLTDDEVDPRPPQLRRVVVTHAGDELEAGED